jgi:hypothetical protein
MHRSKQAFDKDSPAPAFPVLRIIQGAKASAAVGVKFTELTNSTFKSL